MSLSLEHTSQNTGLKAPTTIVKEVRDQFRHQAALSLQVGPVSKKTCLKAPTTIIEEVRDHFRFQPVREFTA